MAPLLRVLMLLDCSAEAEALARELRSAGFELDCRCAATEAACLAELDAPVDLMLADLALPAIDPPRALQILIERQLDIPLIVIAEPSAEDAAIECVGLGAADYVFKDRPARLRSVATRALELRKLRTKARASEMALRASEEHFRAIFESSGIGIALCDLEGYVLVSNTAFQTLLGYDDSELRAKHFETLIHPDERSAAGEMYRGLVSSQDTSYRAERRYVHKSGRTVWVCSTVSAIRDDNGARFTVVMLEDITARKQADEALRQQSAFVRLLQEVAVAANQARSLDQALQTALSKICAHIGWPVGHVYLPDPETPGGLMPTGIWHLEDPQRFETFRKITESVRLAPGIGLPGRVLTSRESGWVSDMVLDASTPRTKVIKSIGVRAGFALPVLLGDEVAAVLEFFATQAIEPDQALLDVLSHVGTQLGRVVERARSEAALRASEERFRVLFEHSPDAIILIDPHHPDISWPIVECNDVACRMNGYSRAEMIGQSIDLLNPTPGDPIERGVYLERLRREGTLRFYDQHRRKDGSCFPIEIVSSFISIAGRELVLGIDRDISERMQAEEALRAAEAKYRALVEQIPAVIYTAAIDEHSSTSYVSPQIESILGFTPEEWLADPNLWLDLVHPDDRPSLLGSIGRARAIESAVPIEFRSFTRDGRIVWLRDASRVVRDQDGQPLFMQGITLDITDRKQAESALLEREAYFRALIEHSADAVALLALDGTILYGSPATSRILGYALSDFVGRNAFDLILPDDRAQIAEQLMRIAQLPEATLSVQARARHADGSWRVLEGTFTNLLSDPAVRAIVNNYRDITESKRAETALRESERLYRTLASNFPNGAVVLFDHELRFTIADGAGLGDFGLTREAMEGRTVWEVYGPEFAEEPAASYHAALAGIPQVREISRGDHTYVVHTLPVRDEHGEIIAGMLMSQDITERKRIEEALIEERALLARRVDERTADLSAANAELARTAMLKDEFLASMSHELRTPLNAVLGLSEALQEDVYGPVNDRQRQTLQHIAESGRHLLELINDILDLAKIGAGRLELNVEPTSIELICQASLRLIKQIAHKRQLSVDLMFDPNVGMLTVDARRLKQILVNLLSNAAKFTPEGGSIGLEVVGDVARQVVDLTVWDTGIGIAHDQMSRLFQPFIQLDSRLARQYEGTGLGLALVYRMVEMHGGSVSVSSEIDRGSRFTVSLPWPAAESGGHSGRAIEVQALAAQPGTIRRALIVEDSPTTADQLTRYLLESQIACTTMPQGSQALAWAIEERPDLIILDLLLPDISGWDVLAQLKADPRTQAIPVLIVSAIDERAHGLALGAAEYLVKPIVPADIRRAVLALALNQGVGGGSVARTAGAAASSAPPVVLLAEDNEANITTVSDYLGAHGYQVIVARSGAEAVARAREARPAIVLMDIQMPGMDGLEATRRIRAVDDLPQMPIIAMTALAMPGDRERCLAAGADDYLSKPVSLRNLATLIETQLHHTPQERSQL
ncbi:MAG TPA: PAS domain S-box protein [Roseiflexaceae bacterium]|nr:PAS domain S-box protein [Roseiflexaceae bacterium]